MSKTLTSLVAEVAEIETKIIESNGEITPEIETLLCLNTKELSSKVDNYVGLIQKMEQCEAYYYEKAQFFLTLAKAFDGVKTSCNERMLQALKDLGKDEIKGTDYKFKIYKSPPKLVIDDKEKIPEQFLVIKTDVLIDNAALKTELKSGKPMEGAHLESGHYIKILGNKA